MKKSSLVVTSVAAIFALTLAADYVLSQGAAPAGPNTAVIDITFVFDHHYRFMQLKENMRREVEATEQTLVKERESIQLEIDQLSKNPTFKKGTPEYSQAEEAIARRQASLNIQAQSYRKKFMEQEAKIYLDVYREICNHVTNFAQQNNISLVVRISTTSTDPNDPQEILKELNKAVVFHHPGIDITRTILDGVNRGHSPPAVNPGPAAAPGGLLPR